MYFNLFRLNFMHLTSPIFTFSPQRLYMWSIPSRKRMNTPPVIALEKKLFLLEVQLWSKTTDRGYEPLLTMEEKLFKYLKTPASIINRAQKMCQMELISQMYWYDIIC